jgi:hypothetical protein
MPRVEALVVNHVRRGPAQMTGMGDATSDVLNIVTGGGYADIQAQLAQLDLGLKASIAASAIAACVALYLLFGDRA